MEDLNVNKRPLLIWWKKQKITIRLPLKDGTESTDIFSILDNLNDRGIISKLEPPLELNVEINGIHKYPHILYVMEIVQPKFNKYFSDISSKNKIDQSEDPKPIYFNEKTGRGMYKQKAFVLKYLSPQFKLFSRLFISINKFIEREEVLKLLRDSNYELPNSENKSINTYLISDTVGKLRKKVGLSNRELILSKGNVMLRGVPESKA